jgi:hypothetical protein
VVRAQVVARDRRVALGVLQPVAQRRALLERRSVAPGAVHVLHELGLGLVGLARRHALVRRRRVR